VRATRQHGFFLRGRIARLRASSTRILSLKVVVVVALSYTSLHCSCKIGWRLWERHVLTLPNLSENWRSTDKSKVKKQRENNLEDIVSNTLF
jgi:hypothetical protein